MQVAVHDVVERERHARLRAGVAEQQHAATAPDPPQRLQHRGRCARRLDHEVEVVRRLRGRELAGPDGRRQPPLLLAQAAHDDPGRRPQPGQVRDEQRDRPVAEDEHLVARPRPDLRQSLQHHCGGLDQRAVEQRHVVRQPVREPPGQHDLVGRRTVAREPDLVVGGADVGGAAPAGGAGAARDDPLGDDAMARREAVDAGPTASTVPAHSWPIING